MIREMKPSDSKSVLNIYAIGLETRIATFETRVPSWSNWDLNHHKHSRFVYLENELILGWAALSTTSKRKVYSGVAELSIYVDTKHIGKGIGSQLMEHLIAFSEAEGIWTLFSSVFLENMTTLELHKKFGFRKIGKRERIAQLDGEWRDTLLLERRSENMGS
ncbi:MAG: N-acetyltransferase family protein [Bacteroidota bacterium]